MFKDAKGEWVRNEDTLKEMTGSFFTNLYTTVDPQNFQPILSKIPILVDASMNQKLIEPVTIKKITTVTY